MRTTGKRSATSHPDGCECLSCTAPDTLNADTNTSLADSEIREMILRNNAEEKLLQKGIFQGHGISKGRLRAPYWPVALATDSTGHRYLPDEVLKDLLGDWQSLLDPKRLGRRIEHWKDGRAELTKWIHKEQQKIGALGVGWPASYSPRDEADMGDPNEQSEVLAIVEHNRKTSGLKRTFQESFSEDPSALNSPVVEAPCEIGMEQRTIRNNHGDMSNANQMRLQTIEEMASQIRSLTQGVDTLENERRT